MWTYFKDVYSGGKSKTKHDHIFIEEPRKTAINVFKKFFKIDPSKIACDCCGENYEIKSVKNLRGSKLSSFYENCFKGIHNLEEVFVIDRINAEKILRNK